MSKERWEDIPDYKGYYKVSDFGRVKSLERKAKSPRGFRTIKEKILKQGLRSTYVSVALYKENNNKSFDVHVLVAMAFLNHTPCGHKVVVDHINFDRLDNKLSNIRLITQRENANRKHIESTSEYIGVSWDKSRVKWTARIWDNDKQKYLGRFTNEYDAHLAYQKELKQISL